MTNIQNGWHLLYSVIDVTNDCECMMGHSCEHEYTREIVVHLDSAPACASLDVVLAVANGHIRDYIAAVRNRVYLAGLLTDDEAARELRVRSPQNPRVFLITVSEPVAL